MLIYYFVNTLAEIFQQVDLEKIFNEENKNVKKDVKTTTSIIYVNPEKSSLSLSKSSTVPSESEWLFGGISKSVSVSVSDAKSISLLSDFSSISLSIKSKSISQSSVSKSTVESSVLSAISSSISSQIPVTSSASSKGEEKAISTKVPLLAIQEHQSSRVPGEKYWSTVILEQRPNKVLIDVKTITVIESVISEPKSVPCTSIISKSSAVLSESSSSKSSTSSESVSSIGVIQEIAKIFTGDKTSSFSSISTPIKDNMSSISKAITSVSSSVFSSIATESGINIGEIANIFKDKSSTSSSSTESRSNTCSIIPKSVSEELGKMLPKETSSVVTKTSTVESKVNELIKKASEALSSVSETVTPKKSTSCSEVSITSEKPSFISSVLSHIDKSSVITSILSKTSDIKSISETPSILKTESPAFLSSVISDFKDILNINKKIESSTISSTVSSILEKIIPEQKKIPVDISKPSQTSSESVKPEKSSVVSCTTSQVPSVIKAFSTSVVYKTVTSKKQHPESTTISQKDNKEKDSKDGEEKEKKGDKESEEKNEEGKMEDKNIKVELGLLRKIQKYADADQEDVKETEGKDSKGVTDLISVLKELPDKSQGDKIYVDGDFITKGEKDQKKNFKFEGWISKPN